MSKTPFYKYGGQQGPTVEVVFLPLFTYHDISMPILIPMSTHTQTYCINIHYTHEHKGNFHDLKTTDCILNNSCHTLTSHHNRHVAETKF